MKLDLMCYDLAVKGSYLFCQGVIGVLFISKMSSFMSILDVAIMNLAKFV